MDGPTRRDLLRVLTDGAIIALAFVGAFLVRFDGTIPADRQWQLLILLPAVAVTKVVALRLAGADRHSWQYTSISDVLEISRALVATTALLLAARLVVGGAPTTGLGVIAVPLGVIVSDLLLSVTGVAGVRVLRRLQSESREADQARSRAGGRPRRVLLIGAGRAGVLTAKEIQRRPDLGMKAVAFLDDNPDKVGRRVAGLEVVGRIADIGVVARDHDIDQAVITIAALKRPVIRHIVDTCADAGVPTKIVPGLYEIVGGDVKVSRIRDVDVADLLGRDQVELDETATSRLVSGRCVMVTGAGGSIGSELVRQAARLGPRRIVLVERAEPALWSIHREIVGSHPELDVVPVVADVVDATRMASVFGTHAPDVVIHAAAHKHVPMMEVNPGEAVKNNVGGTRVVADLAAKYGVLRFVLVSTDKAVNPTSIMGATKRLSERYVQHVSTTRDLHAMSVRFGNVLGSMGSVVPIFRQQVADGGPVTVTHPDMRRYFMTIPEASQLVLQATTIGRPGEILVLDMGEPVKILDLARAVIQLSGFEPDVDIPITFTGLRPGEKLFEELSLSEENATRTRHPKIWIGSVPRPRWDTAEADLADLLEASDAASTEEVRTLIASLVPEFITDDDPRQPDDVESAAESRTSPTNDRRTRSAPPVQTTSAAATDEPSP